MDCPNPQRIHELLDGELTPSDERELREHLATCAGCRTLSREVAVLKSLVRSPDSQPRASESLRRAVLDGLGTSPGPRHPAHRIRPSGWWAAAAALLVAAGVAAYLVFDPAPEALAHTRVLSGCLQRFDDVLPEECVPITAGTVEAVKERVVNDVLAATGRRFDDLPVIPAAAYCGSSEYVCPVFPQVRGVRLDFKTDDGHTKLICVFVIPLDILPLRADVIKELGSDGHVCRCSKTDERTFYCEVTPTCLVNVIADVDRTLFAERHKPRK